MKHAGWLIIVDGAPLAGKTSLVTSLKDRLSEKNIANQTFNLADIDARSQGIKEVIDSLENVEKEECNLEVMEQAYALKASLEIVKLVKFIAQYVKPLLDQGKVVILDQYIDTIYADYGRTDNLKRLIYTTWQSNVGMFPHLLPDVAFNCLLTPQEAYAKANLGEENPIYSMTQVENTIDDVMEATIAFKGLTSVDIRCDDYEKADFSEVDRLVQAIFEERKQPLISRGN
jgi:thymidylate kinase